MTELSNPTVHALMERALKPLDPATLVIFAAEMTRPKSEWKGPRKMSREEAVAATRLVTEMMGRYDLTRSKVLSSGGHASAPGATSRFFLSRRDMRPGAVVTKRLATGIGAYVDNVRAIGRYAREAGHAVDDAMLLRELADVVDGFLERFRMESAIDPDAELARDIALVARWLSHPGREFELSRYLVGSREQDLDYRVREGEMVSLGPDASDFAFGLIPQVPLLTRIVAWAEAEVSVREDVPPSESEAPWDVSMLFDRPVLKSLGRSTCILCEKVGLGVTVDHGDLRMVFTLAPVAYAGVPLYGPDDAVWQTKGTGEELEYHAIPIPGRPELTADGRHWIDVKWPDRFACPRFEAYLTSVCDDDAGWDEASLYTERHLPVTTETCREFLSGGEWGNFEIARTFMGLTWETVLPTSSLSDAGVESRMVRDRFAALLYSETEPSVAGLLEAEAEKRTKAYDAFLLKAATGERRRKLAFRARMRR